MMKSDAIGQERGRAQAHQEDSPLSPFHRHRSPDWASERRRLRGDNYEVPQPSGTVKGN